MEWLIGFLLLRSLFRRKPKQQTITIVIKQKRPKKQKPKPPVQGKRKPTSWKS